MRLIILFLILLVGHVRAQYMQYALLPPSPAGIYLANGKATRYDSYWGPAQQNLYVWGLDLQIMGNDLFQGQSLAEHEQNSCDVSVGIDIGGSTIFLSGWDRYANATAQMSHPVFFPKPFLVLAGQRLHLWLIGINGYQPIVGGFVVLNCLASVWYTLTP